MDVYVRLGPTKMLISAKFATNKIVSNAANTIALDVN